MEETIVKLNETNPTVTAVIGGAWGDEGKGKIASWASKDADLVIRGTGGANAGHTVVFNGKKIALHLVPGGIVYPQTTCLIGQGTVIDPIVLLDEIKQLEEIGIPNVRERLKISGRAHVVFPYHKYLDELHEMMKENPIGTTKRGIGPAYSDKDNRIGIRVYDLLLDFWKLERKIREATNLHRVLFKLHCEKEWNVDSFNLAKEFSEYGEELRTMVVNGDHLVEKFVSEKKKIVLEGAQAYRLDKDFGDYPDVTSSNCITDGALIGGHLNHKDLKETIVILKAYSSRVGNGPFPTELHAHVKDDVVTEYKSSQAYHGDIIRELGHEYGATTKRPRRTGWFDAVLVRSSKRALGADYLCINHLDTLGEIGKRIGYVKMCVLYNYENRTIEYYPDDMELTGKIPLPIYREFEGGWTIPSTVRKYEDLPDKAKEFIEAIEYHTQIPVKFIGVGPDNEDLIIREDI